MELLKVNWDVVYKYSSDVCLSIQKDGFKPHVIVGLSRGGLVPARIFSDILGIDSILVLGLKSYSGSKKGAIKITQELSADIHGEKVLLVDDVCDSGNSIAFAKEYLLKKGAKIVKSATIHHKPDSVFVPDYFAHTTKSWVCYPWEVNEIDKELSKK